MEGNAVGKQFDTNANKEGFKKVTVGEGKNIKGWEDGKRFVHRYYLFCSLFWPSKDEKQWID